MRRRVSTIHVTERESSLTRIALRLVYSPQARRPLLFAFSGHSYTSCVSEIEEDLTGSEGSLIRKSAGTGSMRMRCKRVRNLNIEKGKGKTYFVIGFLFFGI